MAKRLSLPGIALLFMAFLGVRSLMAQSSFRADSVVFTEFHSKILSENRRIIIHLPLHYVTDTTRKFPVMYVLDGSSQDQHTSDKLSVLATGGMSPACIVVGIQNSRGNRNRDQTPPFMQTETDEPASPMGKAEQFLAFIQTELIPLINQRYRTSGYQTLSGHSRGGLFVLYTLIEQPSLFNARFCYSTPAWRFNDQLINRLAASFKSNRLPAPTFLFLSAGQLENPNIVGSFHRLNAVLKKMRPKNLTWTSYFTPFANHQDNPFLATSRGLLAWSRFIRYAPDGK